MNSKTTDNASQGAKAPGKPVPDVSELRPELRALFDEAARNQGFENIEDLASKSQDPKTS